MKCPECGGVGRIHYGEEWCSACNGTGEIEITNEEWIKSANTERLAEWIAEIRNKCFMCDVIHYDQIKQCPLGNCMNIKVWLKQPHTNKE